MVAGSLTHALVRPDVRLRALILAAAGAAVTAIGAQIAVPWQPVPFTLQTLAVVMCGLTLGFKDATRALAVYVGLGAIGVPVFAEGRSGIGVLMGPTGGYLLAFIMAAAWLGWVADRGWDRKPWTLAPALIGAYAIILGFGSFWLSFFIGYPAAFQTGVAPFLLGDVLKATLAVILVPGAWKALAHFGLLTERPGSSHTR